MGSHLVALCQASLPTYFVSDETEILSSNRIRHLNVRTRTLTETESWLPTQNGSPTDIILTAGASCPDALLDQVLQKIVRKKKKTKRKMKARRKLNQKKTRIKGKRTIKNK